MKLLLMLWSPSYSKVASGGPPRTVSHIFPALAPVIKVSKWDVLGIS